MIKRPEGYAEQVALCSHCGEPEHVSGYGCPDLCCQNCGEAFAHCVCG